MLGNSGLGQNGLKSLESLKAEEEGSGSNYCATNKQSERARPNQEGKRAQPQEV